MFLKLFLNVVLFAWLVSAQENSGDKTIEPELKHYLSDTTLIEIFSTISKEHKTFLDIPPLPIFDELTDLDNENVDQVIESISEFNRLVNNDQKTLRSVEQLVKSSKDYDTCETDILLTECTYFRDKGDYSITVKQEISARRYRYAVYFTGIFEGVDYGSMYLLLDQYITQEKKHFSLNIYRPASPPECANELWYSFDKYVLDDETTIYTPWGTSRNQEIILKSTRYWCYSVFGKKENHPVACHEMSIKGDRLSLRNFAWSYKNESLYSFWVGMWDFESHKGTWITFGTVLFFTFYLNRKPHIIEYLKFPISLTS